MKQWILKGSQGAKSLQLEEVPTPEPGDYEILVKFHAASLNFRDLMIINGTYYYPSKDNVVPGSDAAGEVTKTGPKVSRFQVGQRVSPLFHLTHLYGSFTPNDMSYQLGSSHDGIFREYAVFNEQGCVEIPTNLSYREAATLPCAALTAWNSLYGGPRKLQPGDTVLTQGTGGVSIFALQFARMGGAQVISTTSSAEKGGQLHAGGAHAVINYKEDDEWGNTAKKLSKRQKGADFIIEIGGPNTLAQSRNAVVLDGQIAIIGTRGGAANNSSGSSHGGRMATERRILVGSRQQFEDMNAAIEINHLKPVIDAKAFGFHELEKAYDYFGNGQHYGKIVVDFA